MKITIIYDNTACAEGLRPDWGFSCLVEPDQGTGILFDTGADGGILLANMESLGLDPASVGDIVISHAHFDHAGGLDAFMKVNGEARVYVPASVAANHPRVVRVEGPMEIREGVFSTGELSGIEQSMAVATEKGVVLIVGCSHPGMASILDAASQFGRVYAVVGGMHGFSEFELLKDLDLLCPAHCTVHIKDIAALYPEKYVEAGAGRIIEM